VVLTFVALAFVTGCGGSAPTPYNAAPTPYNIAPTPYQITLSPTHLPTTAPGFSATGSMSVARTLATATLLSDGRVLIAGGFGNWPPTSTELLPDALASAELYDPKTGTFSPTGSMTTTRVRHTATLLRDGRVLIAGGFTKDDDYLASAELYDPTTGTFSPTGSMTTARYVHAATLLSDGRVLISGGEGAVGISASAELYDPTSGTFSPTGSMTTAREYHTSTLLLDGRVLITGGEKDQQTSLLVPAAAPRPAPWAELYDPTTGKFRATGSIATARDDYTATLLLDGHVLIAGGTVHVPTPLSGDVLASTELYDPKHGTFSPTASMTAHRFRHTATLLSDGRVLITGGSETTLFIGLASAEIYDPKAGMFTATGSKCDGRTARTATLLSDGRVLIAGGGWTGHSVASAELFQP